MELSIIIVNYNTPEKLFACLDSIFKNLAAHFVSNFEVIVVENGSTKKFPENFSSLYPKVNLVISKKNLGMGGGNNLGVDSAKGSYVLILNPDTIVLKSSIDKMLEYFKEHQEIGIIGPQLLNADLSIQYSCRRFPKLMTPIYRRTFLGSFFKKKLDEYLMKDFNHKFIKEVDWMLGACFLLRKDFFLELKGFDEKNFFMYFEDVDLCKRIKKTGKKVVYFPDAKIIHDHARESAKQYWFLALFINRLTRIHVYSWVKFLRKWGW